MNAFANTNLLTEEQKQQFVSKLEKSLDLKETDKGPEWKCSGEHDFACDALSQFNEIDVEKVLSFFESHGGYCDCEIMLNVICAD